MLVFNNINCMKKIKRIIKNFCKFENLDFNSIAEIFKTLHTESIHSSMWKNDYALHSTFEIRNVQRHEMFFSLYKKFNDFYNVPKYHGSNLDIFFSFAPGTSSIAHSDSYDVGILAAHNDVVVRVNDEKYILNSRDLITIYAKEPHQVIGIDPRIILSFGHTPMEK